MKRKRTPLITYPPGFFSELVQQHNFPPAFVPRVVWRHDDYMRQQNARSARDDAITNGRGWGTGTLPMPKTPKHAAPGSMRRLS